MGKTYKYNKSTGKYGKENREQSNQFYSKKELIKKEKRRDKDESKTWQ